MLKSQKVLFIIKTNKEMKNYYLKLTVSDFVRKHFVKMKVKAKGICMNIRTGKPEKIQWRVADASIEGSAAWKAKEEMEYMAKVKSGEIVRTTSRPFANI